MARLNIEIDATGAVAGANKVTRSVRRMSGATARAGRKMGKAMRGFKNQLFTAKTAIVGLIGAMGARQVVGTIAQFESLEASLITVTGSLENAQAAMAGIQELAATTPYQVSQVTDAFIKLKALGLTPSEEAIRAYGNTASALGKDLNQMIEAVADAATGEFERLKEFGIKAKQNATDVAFTFQGQTTVIEKNAESIEKFLMGIGQNQFAGAMARQMDTINGKTSNFMDLVDKVFVALGEKGFKAAIKWTIDFGASMVQYVLTAVNESHKFFVAFFGAIEKGINNVIRFWEKFSMTMTAIWDDTIADIKNTWAGMIAFVAKGAEAVGANDLSMALNQTADSFREAKTPAGEFVNQLQAIDDKYNQLNETIDENVVSFFAAEEAKAAKQAELAARGLGGDGAEKPKQFTKDSELDTLRDKYTSELDLLGEKFTAERDLLAEKLAADRSFQSEHDQLLKSSREQQAKDELVLNKKLEKQKLDIKLKSAIKAQNIADNLAVLMTSKNKEMFEIGKAAATASALINTYQGATKALAQGGFWGIAMAAAVVAAGIAQVQSIQAQQFGGGGGGAGGGAIGGGGASTGFSGGGALPGAIAPPTEEAGEIRAPVPDVTINLGEDDTFISTGSVRKLVERINDVVGDGATIRTS